MIPIRDNIKSVHYPIVNTALIAACVVVFIYQMVEPAAIEAYAFRPAYLASLTTIQDLGYVGAGGSLLLSMFMHAPLFQGGLLHIGLNMLFLWVFGDNVEDRMGHLRYLVFYLICGVLATLAHSVISILGALTYGGGSLQIPLVGASGAIAGVLGAYYKLYRHASVRALIPLFFIFTMVDLPASLFIIIWFILQLLYGVSSLGQAGGGVAFWAHIGGFVAGILLVRFFAPQRRSAGKPRVVQMRID